jgi:predicted CopG family antitoxin
MTDFSKYKNITVDNDTYSKISKLQTKMVSDDLKISRSQVIRALVNEKVRELGNGKANTK